MLNWSIVQHVEGTPWEWDGTEYRILRPSDIVGVVEASLAVVE